MITRISKHRFTFLLAALLLLLLLAPVVQVFSDKGDGNWGAGAVAFLFALVLLTAVPAVSNTRGVTVVAIALAIPSIVLRMIDVASPSYVFRFAHHVFEILFLTYAIVLIVRYLFVSDRVTLNTVNASLCIYMLLGVLWFNAYVLLDMLDRNAFSILDGQFADTRPAALMIERSIALLYFSFTTLTTVGFGDITPVSAFARMFSVTEAIAGQVILVVLVSRLVGMHVAQSTGARPAESRGSELE